MFLPGALAPLVPMPAFCQGALGKTPEVPAPHWESKFEHSSPILR